MTGDLTGFKLDNPVKTIGYCIKLERNKIRSTEKQKTKNKKKETKTKQGKKEKKKTREGKKKYYWGKGNHQLHKVQIRIVDKVGLYG